MMRIFLAAGLVMVLNACVFGRSIQKYTYERLFKEADLVVIGYAVESVETKDTNATLGNDYVGKNVTFVVNHTLKGTAGGGKINVLHFRFVGTVPRDDGPVLVDFRLSGQDEDPEFSASLSSKVVCQYLLFLKRMPDGRYEPVSGQVDPFLAVKKLSPAPEVEKQATDR